MSVRETRLTGIMSHVFIGLSLLFIDQLQLIPRPVLDGLFLYLDSRLPGHDLVVSGLPFSGLPVPGLLDHGLPDAGQQYLAYHFLVYESFVYLSLI